MGKFVLNYIYLSKKHAGGKDQVGLNLLKGLHDNGVADQYAVICYQYSLQTLKALAPETEYIALPDPKAHNELERMLALLWNNTFRIPRLIKSRQFDVIYHQSDCNGLRKMPCISVEIPHDIKAISHRVLGNIRIPWYKYYLYRFLYYSDFSKADYIIAISDEDSKEIGQYYKRYQHKIRRIYNPIITPALYNKKSDIDGPYICALNLQFHHKNIITLIKAFELLKDNIPHKLILMGNVPERVKYLKEYVAQHKLDGRVIFTGFVSDEDAHRIIAGSNLYINPTLYEGFGMTAVEAMMLQVPVLLSDIPTNREITQNRCRYYSPVENEHALAEAILDSLRDPPAASVLAEDREAMICAYDHISIAKEYHDFFMEVARFTVEKGHT